jgi:hypothetical protein
LDARLPAFWHRGGEVLIQGQGFLKNPRLPVNRGFFAFYPKPNERKNMNKNETRVPARFGLETRFELRPAPPAPFRAIQETEFERLKNCLLARQLAEAPTPELNPPLRRAANDAAALAWATLYPLLVFPVLFEEKTQAALRQAERQARIFESSRELLAV